MNNIITTKRNGAVFLAIVLVTGTIAAIFPFMGIAQAESYYDGMDNRYNSYQSDYSREYKDNNNDYYNSYESDYENDNSYESDYENDNSYESQYQSYGKDNYNSQKESSINKLKCINTNLNINGNNTGDINVGNKGQISAVEEGYLGGYSSDGGYSGGYGGYSGGYDGYSKKDKGFDCVINNNNNNTNTNIIGDGGNQTIPPEPTTANLNVTKTMSCNPQEFGDLCNFNPQITVTGNNPTPSSFLANDTPVIVTLGAGLYSVSEAGFELGMQPCFGRGFDGGQQIEQNIIVCTNISDSCSEDIRTGQELSCTIENTVTTFFTSQGIADSSITSQGIVDSSTVEKLAKLKAQWLDLLP